MAKHPQITIPISKYKHDIVFLIVLCFNGLCLIDKQEEIRCLLKEISHKSDAEIRDIISKWFTIE